jgi:hypothetical protein
MPLEPEASCAEALTGAVSAGCTAAKEGREGLVEHFCQVAAKLARLRPVMQASAPPR